MKVRRQRQEAFRGREEEGRGDRGQLCVWGGPLATWASEQSTLSRGHQWQLLASKRSSVASRQLLANPLSRCVTGRLFPKKPTIRTLYEAALAPNPGGSYFSPDLWLAVAG